MNDDERAVERVEYGTPGHLCVADRCQFRRHTRVGKWRISTIGDYWPLDAHERETIGAWRYFETMVFALGPDGEPIDWNEVEADAYDTAEEAQAGHEEMVRKYTRAETDPC